MQIIKIFLLRKIYEAKKSIWNSGIDDSHDSVSAGFLFRRKDLARPLDKIMKDVGSILPLINIRMLVMAHNEHQTEKFLSFGKSLGADIVSYKTFECRKGGAKADFSINKQYQRYDLNKRNSPYKGHMVWNPTVDYRLLIETANAQA
jgi:hypothetical protein